jgi:hypothetical protein
MFKKIESFRKAAVAFVIGNSAAIALVTAADFSTWQGVVAFVVAELNAFGVYAVANKPKA